VTGERHTTETSQVVRVPPYQMLCQNAMDNNTTILLPRTRCLFSEKDTHTLLTDQIVLCLHGVRCMIFTVL